MKIYTALFIQLALLSHETTYCGEGRNRSPLSHVVKVSQGTAFLSFLWARICPEKEPGAEACSQAPTPTSLLTHTPPAIGPPSELRVPESVRGSWEKGVPRGDLTPGSRRRDARLGA